MCYLSFFKKLLFILLFLYGTGGAVTVRYPNGGEELNSGQKVTIQWEEDSIVGYSYKVECSYDNGSYWSLIAENIDDTSCDWYIPLFMDNVNSVLIKVSLEGITGGEISDVSNSIFKIIAIGNDDYEKNDSIEIATSFNLGDTLKNLIIPTSYNTSNVDNDFFKVENLLKDEMLMVRILEPNGNGLNTNPYNKKIQIYNSSKNLIKGLSKVDTLSFKVPSDGTYYVKITGENNYTGFKYGLEIKKQIQSLGLSIVSPLQDLVLSGGDELMIEWSSSQNLDKVIIEMSAENENHWIKLDENKISGNQFKTDVAYLSKEKSYLTRVIGVSGSVSDTVLSPKIKILSTNTDPLGNNNSLANAFTIKPGEYMTGLCISQDSIYNSQIHSDEDWFKLNSLVVGNKVELKIIDFKTKNLIENSNIISITMYKKSGELIGKKSGVVSYTFLAEDSVYYCKIQGNESTVSLKYDVDFNYADYTIKVEYPNGGEIFNAGDNVEYKWSAKGNFKYFLLRTSQDGGANWFPSEGIRYDDTCNTFITPYRLKDADSILLKISGIDINGNEVANDISDNSFKIIASGDDTYEPNDDFSNADTLTLGDSLSNYIIPVDSLFSLSLNPNLDKFIIPNCKVGDLVKIKLSSHYENIPPLKIYTYKDENNDPLQIGNVTYVYGSGNKKDLNFSRLIETDGSYFFEIYLLNPYDWMKYSISTTVVNVSKIEKINVDKNDIKIENSISGKKYFIDVNSDSSGIGLSMEMDSSIYIGAGRTVDDINMFSGSVITGVIDYNGLKKEVADAVNEKTICIQPDSRISDKLKNANVGFPINILDKRKLIICQYDEVEEEWCEVSNTSVDNVNNTIIAHIEKTSNSTERMILGLFTKNDVSDKTEPGKLEQIKYHIVFSSKGVSISLKNIDQNLSFKLCDVKGRAIVKKEIMNTSNINIPINNIAKGMYFMNIKTEKHNYNKKLFIK